MEALKFIRRISVKLRLFSNQIMITVHILLRDFSLLQWVTWRNIFSVFQIATYSLVHSVRLCLFSIFSVAYKKFKHPYFVRFIYKRFFSFSKLLNKLNIVILFSFSYTRRTKKYYLLHICRLTRVTYILHVVTKLSFRII